jgi:hypothetical protein
VYAWNSVVSPEALGRQNNHTDLHVTPYKGEQREHIHRRKTENKRGCTIAKRKNRIIPVADKKAEEKQGPSRLREKLPTYKTLSDDICKTQNAEILKELFLC